MGQEPQKKTPPVKAGQGIHTLEGSALANGG
jgi:hypothetical protein